jgi:hypothetical protein
MKVTAFKKYTKQKPDKGSRPINRIQNQRKTHELVGADAAQSLFKAMGLHMLLSITLFQTVLLPSLTFSQPFTYMNLNSLLLNVKLQGKKTMLLPASAFTPPIPKSILDHHQHITLVVDFFYVNGICISAFYFS